MGSCKIKSGVAGAELKSSFEAKRFIFFFSPHPVPYPLRRTQTCLPGSVDQLAPNQNGERRGVEENEGCQEVPGEVVTRDERSGHEADEHEGECQQRPDEGHSHALGVLDLTELRTQPFGRPLGHTNTLAAFRRRNDGEHEGLTVLGDAEVDTSCTLPANRLGQLHDLRRRVAAFVGLELRLAGEVRRPRLLVDRREPVGQLACSGLRALGERMEASSFADSCLGAGLDLIQGCGPASTFVQENVHGYAFPLRNWDVYTISFYGIFTTWCNLDTPVILACMDMRKYRWSKTYESAEEELLSLFEVKKISSERIVLEPYDTANDNNSGDGYHVWCAEGSLTVTVADKRVPLQPGDALAVPANSVFSIAAGLSGCAYYLTA